MVKNDQYLEIYPSILSEVRTGGTDLVTNIFFAWLTSTQTVITT